MGAPTEHDVSIEWGVMIDKDSRDGPTFMPFLAKRWAEVWISTFGDKYKCTLIYREIGPWRESTLDVAL